MTHRDSASRGIERARSTVIVMVIASLLLLAGVYSGALIRWSLTDDIRPELSRALGLSQVALTAPGRPPRMESPPAVNLSFSPELLELEVKPREAGGP